MDASNRSRTQETIRRLLKAGQRALAALVGAIAGLLIVRLLFRLLIANPNNPAVQAVYTISRPLLFPWAYVWPPPRLPGLTVERATIAALGTYFLIGLLLSWGRHRWRSERKGD